MSEREFPSTSLDELKSRERSLVLSFLSLSERSKMDDRSAMDELALSIALKSALKKAPN